MDLNEAIKHCHEKAEEIRKANEEMPTDCKLSEDLCECANENEQLAEWLKDYKRLLEMPKGDLVSREALIKEFEKLGYTYRVTNIIDNAPTVDIKDELAGAYNEGYMCGSREAEKARMQGEWIRTGSLGNGNAHYECSNCHHGDEHAESQEVPYCWFCGARMKKGGAE